MMCQKKGSLLIPLTIFFAIAMLAGLIALTLVKFGTFEKSLGDRQLELFTVYQTGEKYLHYVDESAKLAIKPALLKTGQAGLKKVPGCGSFGASQQVNLWSRENMDADCKPQPQPCPPSSEEAKQLFVDYFKPEYEAYINAFNNRQFSIGSLSSKIPIEYSSISVSPNGLQVFGVASGSVVIESVDFKNTNKLKYKYSVKPSFTQPLDENFVEDGSYMAAKAAQLQPLGPNAGQLSAQMSRFNSESQKYKWSLEGNKIVEVPDSCRKVTGTCTYPCRCVTVTFPCPAASGSGGGDSGGGSGGGGEGGGGSGAAAPAEVAMCSATTCQTCIGTAVEITTFNNRYAPISVDTGKVLYVYKDSSKKVEPASMTYKFGLGWIDSIVRTPDCEKTEGE